MDDSGQWARLPELVGPVVAGTGLAFVISIIRALYDSKEPRFIRVFLEACMCAGLTVAAIAIEFLVFPALASDIVKAVLVGGGSGAFVGFLGVYQIRRLILKFLNIHISGKS